MKPSQVDLSPYFLKQLARLERKFHRPITEVDQLVENLEAGQRPGDKIPQVGRDVYKVRLANSASQQGKRGGFRVLYYIQMADLVVLIAIYSKSEQSDLPLEVIRQLIEAVLTAHTPDEE